MLRWRSLVKLEQHSTFDHKALKYLWYNELSLDAAATLRLWSAQLGLNQHAAVIINNLIKIMISTLKNSTVTLWPFENFEIYMKFFLIILIFLCLNFPGDWTFEEFHLIIRLGRTLDKQIFLINVGSLLIRLVLWRKTNWGQLEISARKFLETWGMRVFLRWP